MNEGLWSNAPAEGRGNWNTGAAQPQESKPDAKKPPAPKLYARMPLRNLGDVQKAMATIIRESRSGRLDISDGSKLVNMLSCLARVIEGGDLERRIDELEGRM